ncbi:hypothetical protein VTO73DRAFT_4413 [Trametes versicolor]
MASRPVLNHDILLEVTAAACWDYAAALLDTCRFIHYEGHKALLRQTVYLDSPATLLDFLAFLRYGLDDARHSSVRDLYLALERSRMMKQASPQLLLSLPLMHNLASLSISESEFVFDDDFGLCGAFAALTSLRELHLPAAGERTVQFLQASQSTFVTVNISFPPEYDEDGFFDECITPMDAWPQYHPAVLLANSRLTLRDLECERWYTHPEIMPDPGIVYPEMRRLRMASASMPLTLPFVRAYPNLSYLSIHTGESDDGHCYASDIQGYADHRRKNMLAQAPLGCSWAELGEYSGSLVDFYLLGLVCPVGRVELRALHRNHRYMLGPALSCARPRRLVLHGWPGLLESPPDVFAALQGEAGSRLEHLSLDARLDGKDRDVDVSIILEGLMSSLAHAPLRSLEVTIFLPHKHRQNQYMTSDELFALEMAQEDDDFEEDDVEEDDAEEDVPNPSSPSPGPTHPSLPSAERSGDEFDIDDYVRRFRALVPTLEKAVVRLI